MQAGAPIEVVEAGADESPGRELLAAMTTELDTLYAEIEGNLHSLPATPEQMAPPEGCFLLLYRGGEPIACGGLKRLSAETGEIKRMYVVPSARGAGVGRRLLDELEARAEAIGYRRLRLDTGAEQPAARAIYEAAGYRPIPDYNGNPYASHWFEKGLQPGG